MKRKPKKKVKGRKKIGRRPAVRKRKALKGRKRLVRKRVVRRKVAPKTKKPLLKPIGQVTHYFPKVKVGVVKVKKGDLVVGDTIHIKGYTTDFKQRVSSIQLDHQAIQKARKGQEVGIKVKSRVRQRDLVYKI